MGNRACSSSGARATSTWSARSPTRTCRRADGNWLGKGHDAAIDTDYVEFDHLAQWGVDISFIWHTMFTEWFGMHYGAGIGIALDRVASILRISNTAASCTEENAGNVSQCYPAD